MLTPVFFEYLRCFNFVISSVFFGFCVWTFFWIPRRRKEWRFYFSVDEVDKVIVRTVIGLTIINLLIIFYEVIAARYNGVEFETYVFTDRMTGPYWFAYWMNTFIYYLLPFLFWSEKMRKSAALRIIATLLIFYVLFYEKYVIIMTSFHRDYVPIGATLELLIDFLLILFFKLAVFAGLIAILLKIKQLKADKQEISS